MKDVAGRIAIVTGGASGIGQALCEELARRGAVVTVADLDHDAAARVARALADAGGSASSAAVDVARRDSVEELVQDTRARHGRIDLMVNNAGIGWSGEFHEMAPADLDCVVRINVNGVLYGALAALPVMVTQGSGHIVNTASFFSGLIPVPGMAVYSATKHAVVGFSLALREEARMFGVNVSVVCPSFIRSNIDANSSTILRSRKEATASPLSSSAPEATRLARAVIEGVSRNTPVIVMPPFARGFWWLYRLAPRLFFSLHYPIFLRTMRGREPTGLTAVALGWGRRVGRLLLGRRRR